MYAAAGVKSRGGGIDKARRNLLIASTIGIFVWGTETYPTKVDALGVEFSDVGKMWFLIILAGIVLYLFLAFLAARVDWNKKVAPLDHEARKLLMDPRSERMGLQDAKPDDSWLLDKEQSVSWFRYPKLGLAHRREIDALIRLLETWFPAVFAIATSLALLWAALDIYMGHHGGGMAV